MKNFFPRQGTNFSWAGSKNGKGGVEGPQRDLFRQQVPSRNPLYIGVSEDLGTSWPLFINARLFQNNPWLFSNNPRLSKSRAVRRISPDGSPSGRS